MSGPILASRSAQLAAGIITVSAAQVASPPANLLQNLTATFQLNVAPYTRYQSNGTALVALGTGTGGSSTIAGATDYAATVQTPIANAAAAAAAAASTANAALPAAQKGVANGVATLGSDSKVPNSQLAQKLASTDLTDGTALNTAVANKLALPTQSYNAATNTPAITQGQPLMVSGSRVLSVKCTVASTTSTGPFSTVAVNDWLVDDGTGNWNRLAAPPVTNYPICGDGLGGERAGVPGIDYAQPWQLNCKIPIGSRPTGATIGTNGAITTAPFPVVYGPTGGVPGIWLWFNANDLYSGNIAGYYWCVFTSATNGTAYANMYSPSSTTAVSDGRQGGVLGSWFPPTTTTAIAGSGAGTALVVDTTRRQALALNVTGSATGFPTVLPVGYMGPEGYAEAEIMVRVPSSTNNKQFGTTVATSLTNTPFALMCGCAGTIATSSYTYGFYRGRLENRHSQSSQISGSSSANGSETVQMNSTPTLLSLNTAVAFYYTMDLVVAAEWIVIELCRMRIVPN